jgi:vitamin B12 transporter
MSSRRSVRWALIVLAHGAGIPAVSAQDQVPPVELEELVVTADRAPTPATRAIAATTVITGEELRQRGVYFLEDALRQAPGATVVSTGSYGGIGSLFVRGGESDQTKVLIDGVPVNQAGGAFNFGTLSTDNVDRIEIVRGPVSVLYGSDAMTGVVQVFTRKGTGRLRGAAATAAGTFGTWRGDVGASGGSDQASFSVGLSRYTSDGVHRFNSSYRSTVASGALTVRPDAATVATLTARTGDNTLHYPTDFAGVVSDSNQVNLQNGMTLGLELARQLTSRAEVRVALASHSQTDGADNAADSPGDTLGFYASQSQARSLRRSLDARGTLQFGDGVRVTAGAQAEFQDLREFTRSEYNFGGGPTVTADPPLDAARRNVGFYGQALVDVGPRILLNLGGRVDENEKFGTHGTYRLGGVLKLSRRFRVRAAAGSGFKEPSLRENYVRTAFEVGNPDLKPEESRSWEVGVEQGLWNGAVTLSASYFDQRFRNLIQYNGAAAPGAPSYENVARATARGVELTGSVRPGHGISVTGSYTFLHTRVDDPGFSTAPGDVFVKGQPLIRRPRHTTRLDGRARIADRATLGVAASVVASREDVDFRPFPSVRTTLPSYVTVDVDAAVDLLREAGGKPGVTATFRVENLFDERYETVVGFPARGRAVLVGARVGL